MNSKMWVGDKNEQPKLPTLSFQVRYFRNGRNYIYETQLPSQGKVLIILFLVKKTPLSICSIRLKAT